MKGCDGLCRKTIQPKLAKLKQVVAQNEWLKGFSGDFFCV